MPAMRLVYTLFATAEEADRVCRTLLDEGLIACANRMGPALSHYRWQGEVVAEAEYPALLKTDQAHVDALLARLGALHSYEVPAMIVWAPEQVSAPYAAWLSAELGGA